MRNPFNFKSKISFKESAFGWDGLSTFIFSNMLFVMTLGTGFLVLFFRTLQVARNTSTTISYETTLLIAGLRLEDNRPIDEYKMRLNRAVAVFQKMTQEKQIIILGGLTGDNTISEARSGADYLLSQGITEKQIITEDHSRHTLENLQNARMLLSNHEMGQSAHLNAAIISSRYHLYRIVTLARGLSLTLQPISAEERFNLTFVNMLCLFKEAYYLHWYWSGKLWVFITANKKSQARIT